MAGALAAVPGVAASPVIGDVLLPIGVLLVVDVLIEELLPVVDVPIEELLSVGVGVVDGVVTGAGVEGDAPVSSTFLPQAPNASRALKATAVRAAGLNLDACMSVSFFEKMNWLDEYLAERQPELNLAGASGLSP